MSESIAIGIDLGTTFSAAAIYQNGQSKIIPNLEGDYLTPSLIFYNPHSLDVSVGNNADEDAMSQIENFLYDMKRIMGRKYDDVYVQKMINSNTYKYKIVKGEHDTCEIELEHDRLLVKKSPEQACSEILKYLKESAERFLGTEVKDAVISVPAYFSNAQRKATKAAAQLAQLNVLKLVTEPVAAAIHYSFDKNNKSTLLVFDWGGGTLDVSIIQVGDKTFEVKSVEGDTFLGSRDFDEILVKYFETNLVKRFGGKILDDRQLKKRLFDICKRIKIRLSTKPQCELPMYCIGGANNQFTLSLTRNKFEELTSDLFSQAFNIVKLVLNNSGLTKENVNDVILVGGTSKIPKIQEMLSTYFNEKKLKVDVNPDEAVALGAALQAAVLKKQCRDLEKYKITEVTPVSIGQSLYKGRMNVFIKKNTPLPFKSNQIGVTVLNDQKSCVIEVCEGERKNCKFNNILGEFEIHNLPPGRAGDIKFKKYFELDEDGILTVTAKETKTGNSGKLVVTVGEYHLCENEIRTAVLDAEKNKKEDDAFVRFVKYVNKKMSKCNNILYDINKVSIGYQEFIKNQCNEFLDKCHTYEYTQFEDFKRAYQTFKTNVKSKIGKKMDIYLNSNSNIDSDIESISSE